MAFMEIASIYMSYRAFNMLATHKFERSSAIALNFNNIL